ncbi:HAMP domain-containing histidine kinase, partial [Hellea sp.]|nr:HAMP domain-containing histidine kinase [Hellea sp.]
RMIEDILQLTHYNNSDIEVIEETLDLNVIFQQLIQEYSERAEEAKVTFRHVPTRVRVQTDGVLVTRIIRNLIQNAVKHAYADKLLLGLRRRSDHVEIWVVDDGRGLGPAAPKAPPKSSASPSNLGLGLIISKQLAAACDTQLILVSNKGRGTCGRLRIPRDKVR